MMLRTTGALVLAAALLLVGSPASAEFIRPMKAGDQLRYGVKGGIVVSIYPSALDRRTDGGPRGLIRVGYEEDGKYYLINFVAVEPVVGGQQGFSELEKGGDGKSGKRIWAASSREDGETGKTADVSGRIHKSAAGDELSFVLRVEPFANGARPQIEVSLFERFPHRVRFRTFAGPGGKNMQRCTLTATMGNQSRCRQLWLRSGALFAPEHYAGYTGTDFVEKQPHGLSELWKMDDGDIIAAISPDEFEPREVWPLPTDAWHHAGKWMAQFWLKPKGSYDKSLHCRVNGRRVYWAGNVPIPGGIAYENFEFRENFRTGQEVWFGYTTESPAEAFGFGYDASPQGAALRKVSHSEEAAIADAARISRPLTNGNFSAGLNGWQVEGGAGAFRTYLEGKQTALTTFGKGKDVDTGRLYQCFKVPDHATELRFSLHGGADGRKTYVALWQRNRLWRRMTGRNDNTPFRVGWDVSALRGEVVSLEIVDESTTEWGFVGVQNFVLAGEK